MTLRRYFRYSENVRRALASLSLAVFVWTASVPLAAGQDMAVARRLYAEGEALFDRGQYEAAEASFRAAYRTRPHPVTLLAIASAEERQGDRAGAVKTLEQYLRDRPDAPDRAQIEARMRRLLGS